MFLFPPPQISHLQKVLGAIVAVPALWEVMLQLSYFDLYLFTTSRIQRGEKSLHTNRFANEKTLSYQ